MNEGRNKAIIILLIVVIALSGIMLYKIYGPKDEKKNNLVNTQNVMDENTIKNEEQEKITLENTNNAVVSNNIVWNIIDIIVIIILIPKILEHYNIGISTIVLTAYKAIRILLTGFSGGFLLFIVLILILLVYCYLLLVFMDKVLLGTGPLTFFFGTIIAEGVLYYIVMFAFALIVARLII